MSAVDSIDPTDDSADRPSAPEPRATVPPPRAAVVDGLPRIDRPSPSDAGQQQDGTDRRPGRAEEPTAQDGTDSPSPTPPDTPSDARVVAGDADIEPHADHDQQSFVDYQHDLIERGRTREADQSGTEYDYQRQWCGDTEYEISSDEAPNPTWADGLNRDLGLAQDAKHVTDEDRSWYVPDLLPPPIRQAAELDLDRRLAKYQDAVNDSANPVRGVEIITNSPAAGNHIAGRMNDLGIPGIVRIRE